jgi:NTP pyrophosphatase (non-canonical NTP hydrolase)
VILSELQKKHAVWQRRNFPNAEKWECLVGLQEEVGELAHAFLKKHQRIRKGENHDALMKDAIGDVVIYLLGFCTLNGIDVDDCIEIAWDEVKERDWRPEREMDNGSE